LKEIVVLDEKGRPSFQLLEGDTRTLECGLRERVQKQATSLPGEKDKHPDDQISGEH
jgi:hypothetical protein